MNRAWIAAVALAAAACTPTTAIPPSAAASPQATLTTDTTTPTAAQTLNLLPIRDADPVGYRRDLFGTPWADTDHNGCDTRNDILTRDLTDDVVKPGTHGCVVLTGTLHDPYTGATIPYQRGQGTSSNIQIDHVVSLGDAWRSGANTWPPERRTLYANWPPNLLAVSGPVNESKGDDTAADWQPPNQGFDCRYAAIVINTKTTFGLTVTRPEHDALARLLAPCPNQTTEGAP